MKYINLILLIFTVSALQALQLKNPDANTLWLEDGKDIKLTDKSKFYHWRAINVDVTSNAKGKGFSLKAQGKKSPKVLTGIKLHKDYPYLTFKINNLNMYQGYCNLTFLINGFFSSVQEATPQKGIYVYDLYKNLPSKVETNLNRYLTIYLSNLKVNFEYLKIVKNPPYLVKVDCNTSEIKPGSKVKFTAYLAEEAEDVSISLIANGVPRSIKVNGKLKIQLKVVDKTQKIWAAEVEIKNIGIKKALSRHKVFLKTDILGGELDEPVFVSLPYSIAP